MANGESAPRARVAWEDPGTGERLERTLSLPARLGRSPDNDLVLSSEGVSREHARLEWEDDQVYLTDLRSRSGTLVGVERVQRAPLQPGDTFRIGPFTLTLEPLAAEGSLPAAVLPTEVEPAASTPPGVEANAAIAIAWTGPEGEPGEVVLVPPVTIGRAPGNSLVLPGSFVSSQHARLELDGDRVVVVDLGSTNGTQVNGERRERAILGRNDSLRIGGYTLAVAARGDPAAATLAEPLAAAAGRSGTVVFDPDTDAMMPLGSDGRAAEGSPPAFEQERVPLRDLERSGLPIHEATYLAIGGGLGSFVWVDHLAIWGADPARITALGPYPKPYGRYQVLTRNSQIPQHERIRSNSESAPDNIWGFPGYAAREAGRAFRQGNLGRALALTWQVFGEPDLTDTFTPLIGDVFASLDREAARIGWDGIWRAANVKTLRMTDDGRYVVAYSRPRESGAARHALAIAPYVQVAVGYPGIRLLDDLREYRLRTGDYQRAVNAYEDHEAIYDQLLRRGGSVLVRGRGIVASRVLQRLDEVRRQNPKVRILNLVRSPVVEGNRFRRARRQCEHHWEYQQFNWPKSTWGGEYKELLEKADDEQRNRLLNDWGGTTTARRRDWRRILNVGQREGWYQIRFGEVERVDPENGRLVTTVRGKTAIAEESRITTDFIIDCTGLESGLEDNPFLHDLVAHYQLPRNPKGRLKVTNDFELVGMANQNGRIYAAGIMTLGGPLAGVDTFLGLQYAAYRSVEALLGLRAPGLRPMTPGRSFTQWIRWARGALP